MLFADQLVLVCTLLAAVTAANPLISNNNQKGFTVHQSLKQNSVSQVSTKKSLQRENIGRHAINKVHRKFGHGRAPAAPPRAFVQKPMKQQEKVSKWFKFGSQKAKSETATTDGQDLEYVCHVQVGGQTVKLNFDTGSSDL